MPGRTRSQGCTLKQLAEIVGVAPSTVSRVLNRTATKIAVTAAMAERIRAAASEHGYVPNINARRLLKNRAYVIGLEVPAVNVGSDAFADLAIVETLRGIEGAILDTDFKLMLLFKHERYMRTQEYLHLLGQRAIDGLLIWGASHLDAYAEQLGDFPVVLVGSRTRSLPGLPFIGCDHAEASRRLTRHAIGRGCRRFVYLAGPASSSVAEERESGFLAALAESPAAACVQRLVGDFREDGARDLIAPLLSSHPLGFDCVICANDQMALGVHAAATERGLAVPGDFALAGADGSLPAVERLGLSTFHCDGLEVGRRATALLLEIIAGGLRQPAEQRIACELLLRRTL